jgi:hypothetical protein
MGLRGPKPWKPTDEERKRVRLYAGLGLTHEQIGHLIGKCRDVIERECREELDKGQAETLAKVAGGLVQRALAGDTTSAIFYLKTQGGWRETNNLNLTTDRAVTINLSRRSPDADA